MTAASADVGVHVRSLILPVETPAAPVSRASYSVATAQETGIENADSAITDMERQAYVFVRRWVERAASDCRGRDRCQLVSQIRGTVHGDSKEAAAESDSKENESSGLLGRIMAAVSAQRVKLTRQTSTERFVVGWLVAAARAGHCLTPSHSRCRQRQMQQAAVAEYVVSLIVWGSVWLWLGGWVCG